MSTRRPGFVTMSGKGFGHSLGTAALPPTLFLWREILPPWQLEARGSEPTAKKVPTRSRFVHSMEVCEIAQVMRWTVGVITFFLSGRGL